MQRIISVTDTMDLNPLSSFFSSENRKMYLNYSLTLKTSELIQINSLTKENNIKTTHNK